MRYQLWAYSGFGTDKKMLAQSEVLGSESECTAWYNSVVALVPEGFQSTVVDQNHEWFKFVSPTEVAEVAEEPFKPLTMEQVLAHTKEQDLQARIDLFERQEKLRLHMATFQG